MRHLFELIGAAIDFVVCHSPWPDAEIDTDGIIFIAITIVGLAIAFFIYLKYFIGF